MIPAAAAGRFLSIPPFLISLISLGINQGPRVQRKSSRVAVLELVPHMDREKQNYTILSRSHFPPCSRSPLKFTGEETLELNWRVLLEPGINIFIFSNPTIRRANLAMDDREDRLNILAKQDQLPFVKIMSSFS